MNTAKLNFSRLNASPLNHSALNVTAGMGIGKSGGGIKYVFYT